MTNDNKKLTKLIDLCGRLPYGVIIEHNGNISKLDTIFMCDSISISSTSLDGEDLYNLDLDEFKPYLFPLSSMTEEQFNSLKSYADLQYEHNTLELVEWNDNCKTLEFWLEEIPSYCVIKVFDWLNKNHFDYRGLIPMGLAIDCTNLGIY